MDMMRLRAWAKLHSTANFSATSCEVVQAVKRKLKVAWSKPHRENVKAAVLAKVVGDFSGWDKDAATYDKAFDMLLKRLQAENAKA